MIKWAAGYGKEKREKIPMFFSKQYFVAGLSL